jgi:hypothetical protein
MESKNYLFLEMDATSEEALLKAGIMKVTAACGQCSQPPC